MKSSAPDGTHGRIHRVVSRIPRGRVATYGQVARLAGLSGQARLVGYAMHALPVASQPTSPSITPTTRVTSLSLTAG